MSQPPPLSETPDQHEGILQTGEYVISEIENWGSPGMNPSKMWDDAVRAGRIVRFKTEFGFTFYALDGEHK